MAVFCACDLDASDLFALRRSTMIVKQAVEVQFVARVAAYADPIDSGPAKCGDGHRNRSGSCIREMFRVHVPTLPKDRDSEWTSSGEQSQSNDLVEIDPRCIVGIVKPLLCTGSRQGRNPDYNYDQREEDPFDRTIEILGQGTLWLLQTTKCPVCSALGLGRATCSRAMTITPIALPSLDCAAPHHRAREVACLG